MNYLFVLKYYDRPPRDGDNPEIKGDINIEAGLYDLISAPSRMIELTPINDAAGVELGIVGVVECDDVEKVEYDMTAAELFFDGVRALTAQLNGVPEAVAKDTPTMQNGVRYRNGVDVGGSYGSYGSDSGASGELAKWAYICFEDLIECFAYVGTPRSDRPTNDYAIVPPPLRDYLTGNYFLANALKLDPDTPDKTGMLGGIGGLGGEP